MSEGVAAGCLLPLTMGGGAVKVEMGWRVRVEVSSVLEAPLVSGDQARWASSSREARKIALKKRTKRFCFWVGTLLL